MNSFKNISWQSILKSIYSPPIGSLWAAPNGIWNNRFAHNKDDTDVHPSVVGRNISATSSCWLIPGSSKTYNIGTWVYRTKINKEDEDCPYTHFLIKLRMTYTWEHLLNLNRGWDGIDCLNDKQVNELKMQIKFCLGIDV